MKRALLLSTTALLVLASGVGAQDRVAQLNKVDGTVTVTRSGSGRVDTARQLGPRVRNGSVFAADVVSTAATATASMIFSDGSLIDLAENTSMAVEEDDLAQLVAAGKETKPRGRSIRVLAGDVLSNVVPNPGVATRFETPSGVAAVKGTVLRIQVMPNRLSRVRTETGEVDFINLLTGLEVKLLGGFGASFLQTPDGIVSVASMSENPGPLRFEVGDGRIGANPGTEFIVEPTDDGFEITVTEGELTFTDSAGNVGTFTQGQKVKTGKKPASPPPSQVAEKPEKEEEEVTTKSKKLAQLPTLDPILENETPSCGECGVAAGTSCVYLDGNCPTGYSCQAGACVEVEPVSPIG